MLRGRTTPVAKGPSYPSFEEAYELAERPMGIQFYWSKESIFLPYALLAGLRWTPDELTLLYPAETFFIRGRGLYELYLHLAEHRVSRIIEQGERYEKTSTATVFIRRILRVAQMAMETADVQTEGGNELTLESDMDELKNRSGESTLPSMPQ